MTNSPDEHFPNVSDQFHWPLQPGVLVQINKMNNVNISQLSPRITSFKTTSVTRLRKFSKYRKRKSKLYARLEKLGDFLSLSSGREKIPSGIKQSENGVVTFRKVQPNPPVRRPAVAASRKRKKPGSAPNLSSIEDKPRLGVALPLGGIADPSSDPDKGFYENLPFHGMQNPPNKPISIIAPFNQGTTAHSFTNSTKSLISSTKTIASNSNPTHVGSNTARDIKRHQSFHGFQSTKPNSVSFLPTQRIFYLTENMGNAHPRSVSSQQLQTVNGNVFPSIFKHLPKNFSQLSGANTISAISHENNRNSSYMSSMTDSVPNSKRVVGRNESKYEIRRTASGLSLSNAECPRKPERNDKKAL
ncbi:hypothetical protein JTB14_034328 [Gonioctena quinquepunctata]|nr:hypothetical protein JTB14_034328 [Gonioctena quinquepunctata]